MTLIQWVNLDSNDFEEYKKIDPEITSKERCGKVSIKTAFEKDKVPLEYKVKVMPVGTENTTYTAAELIRNSNFKMTKGTVDLGSEAEVSMSDEICLPAAGGNKYKLVAKDANGKEVESAEIEVKRKLYYQFMHMEDATGKVTSYPLTQLENHCKKNHITLTKAGADKKIAFHKTVNTTTTGHPNYTPLGAFNHNSLQSIVGAAYDAPEALKNIGCVTVLSNYIADFKQLNRRETISSAGPANPYCRVTATSILINVREYLWHGLDDADDLAKLWFTSGEMLYTPPAIATSSSSASSGSTTSSAPTPVPTTIVINRVDIDKAGSKAFTYGGYSAVEITLAPDLRSKLAANGGTLQINLKLLQTDGFSGGFSYPSGFALTTCCTKSWWEDVLPSESEVIWNHEMGHRIGMVAYGDKTLNAQKKLGPDAPATLYGETPTNQQGHQGPHCTKGVTYAAATDTWTGTPGCVMFGATSNNGVASPLDYCDKCTTVVKKLDLSKEAIRARP